jgi:hypothetical protein
MTAFTDWIESKDPVLWWKMNEASGAPQDSSGNANHAQTDTVSVYQVAGGLQGAGDDAYAMDVGAGQYANRTSALTGAPDTAMTIAMLVKATGAPASYSNYAGSGGWSAAGSWLLYESATQIQFGVGDSGAAQRNAAFVPGVPRDGLFHRLLGVYDPAATGEEVKIYLDGVQVGRTNITNAPTGLYTGGNFGVGTIKVGGAVTVTVDEVSLHATAWTREEIAHDAALVEASTTPVPVFWIGALAVSVDNAAPYTCDVTLPVTTEADDIILVVAAKNNAADLTVSGYTAVVAAQNNANFSTGLFWKRATGAESGPVITSSTTGGTTAGIYGMAIVVRGALATASPFDDAQVNGSPTSDTAPTSTEITTDGDSRLVFAITAVDDDPSPSSGYPPSGWAIGTTQGSTTGGDCRIFIIEKRSDTATEAAVVTGTLPGADYWRVFTVAMIPAPTSTTYQKAGLATLGLVGKGADAVERIEAGRAVLSGVAKAADSVTRQEAGRAVLSGVASGASQKSLPAVEYVKAGIATLGLIARGADAAEHRETGRAALSAVASAVGFAGATYEKAGTAVLGREGTLIGPDTVIGPDDPILLPRPGFILSGTSSGPVQKVGRAAATLTSSGADVHEARESGQAAATFTLSGTQVVERVRAGAAVLSGVASGADVAEHVESGQAALSGVASGAKTREVVRAGTATLGLVSQAADSVERIESGAAVLSAVASGVSAASKTYLKAGTAVAGMSVAGGDVAEHVERGSAVVSLEASGTAGAGAEYVKAGSAVLGLVARANDAHEAVRTGSFVLNEQATSAKARERVRAGSAVLGMRSSAQDVHEAVEGGTAVLALEGRAASQKSGVISKRGTATLGMSAQAADSVTVTRTGQATISASASAADSVTRVESGSATLSLEAKGAAEETQPAPTVNEVAGSATLGWSVSGASAHGTVYAKAGAAVLGLSTSASDAAEMARGGTVTLNARAGASDAAEYVEVGLAALNAVANGARAVEFLRAGGAVLNLVINGTAVGETWAAWTYGGSVPDEMTYGGTAPADWSYGGTAPDVWDYGGTAPDDWTYGGTEPAVSTYGGTP